MKATKKASQLTEGESITYSLDHTPTLAVQFCCEYSIITCYVFDPREESGLSNGYCIDLPPAILDTLQEKTEHAGQILEEILTELDRK